MDIEKLKQDAAALLADGRAGLVIGFRERAGECVPTFLTDAGQADGLTTRRASRTWRPTCGSRRSGSAAPWPSWPGRR